MTELLAVDIPTAATMLCQSARWVEREIKAGRLKAVKRGRSTRIRMDDLRAFNASRDDSAVTQIAAARRRRSRAIPAGPALPDIPMPLEEYAGREVAR